MSISAFGDLLIISQGLVVLILVSLVLTMVFQREWVMTGWTLEGLALIRLFRRCLEAVPNRDRTDYPWRCVGMAHLQIGYIGW